MKFETILFDLDGTLTNPEEGITTSVAYALDAYGYKYESKSALRIFIGPPLREQFMSYCGIGTQKGEEMVAKYREYYAVTGIYQNLVYDGIPEMLAELKNKGKKLVVASSKPEKFVKIILDHFDLAKYFDFVAGALMSNSRTDKSEVIEYALSNCGGFDKSTTVMVGDRMHDVIGGKNHNLSTVGVTFGFGSRKELADACADYICENTSELLKLLSE